MFLYPGFSTLGEIDSVLFVGPIAPATYLFTPTIYRVQNIVLCKFKVSQSFSGSVSCHKGKKLKVFQPLVIQFMI